jgi:hypothetical protein
MSRIVGHFKSEPGQDLVNVIMPPLDVTQFCPQCGLVSYPLSGCLATRFFVDSGRWMGDLWYGGEGADETWWKREPHVCWSNV